MESVRVRQSRNSSVELLRIIAMLMIVGHHFVKWNGFDVPAQPLGVGKIILESLFDSGGKPGVVMFFTISVWHLSDRDLTLKDGLRRVWLMERELLFYSLSILLIFLVFDRTAIPGCGSRCDPSSR